MSYFEVLQRYTKLRKHWETTGQAICRAAELGDHELLHMNGQQAWDYFIERYIDNKGRVKA